MNSDSPEWGWTAFVNLEDWAAPREVFEEIHQKVLRFFKGQPLTDEKRWEVQAFAENLMRDELEKGTSGVAYNGEQGTRRSRS